MVHARLLPFVTAERTPGPTMDRQVRLFAESPAAGILDRLPMGVAVFNTARQIIYANEAFCALSDSGRGVADVIGLRLGDALACLGARLDNGVCGTTQLCRSCGAAKSLAASLAGAASASGDCSISRQGVSHLDNLDFRIWIWALRHAD